MFDALILTAAALLHPAPTEVAFGELAERAEELDGQEIVIEGYITQCGQTKCVLRMKKEGDGNRYLAMSLNSPAYSDILANAPGKIRVTARLDASCIINPCIGSVTDTLLVSNVERLEES